MTHTIPSSKNIMASEGTLKVVKVRILDYICILFTPKSGNNVVACMSITFRPLTCLYSQVSQVSRKKLMWIPHCTLPTLGEIPPAHDSIFTLSENGSNCGITRFQQTGPKAADLVRNLVAQLDATRLLAPKLILNTAANLSLHWPRHCWIRG